MRIRPIFAWYDLWIGVFIDRAKGRAYILPLPCVGIVIEWGSRGFRCVPPPCDEVEEFEINAVYRCVVPELDELSRKVLGK